MRLPALVRRALVLTAGLATVATLATPATAATAFADLDTDVYAPAVSALAERDVVQGCTDQEFCPTAATTRGQLATLLVRALEVPASDVDRFTDDDGHVHEDDLDAAAAAGLLSGCDDGRACPDRAVTRGEMASMLSAAFDLSAGDTAYFADAGDTHATAIRSVADAGVAAGCTDGRFCPADPVRRGEVALFLARALDLVGAVEPITLAEHRAQVQAAQEEEIRQAELAAEQERLQTWERLAQCESGGNWHINTGNGYYGGLQFSLSSWRAVGGSGYPHQATKAEQIKRAEILLDRQGWGAWPACSRKLGLR